MEPLPPKNPVWVSVRQLPNPESTTAPRKGFVPLKYLELVEEGGGKEEEGGEEEEEEVRQAGVFRAGETVIAKYAFKVWSWC